MSILLSQLAPITDTIGFLECPADEAANAFLDWQRGIQAARGVRVTASVVSGPLHEALRSLLPLTSVERRRFLFAPTKSLWTAFFDNGHRGTDAFAPVSFLAQRIGCRGIRATQVRETPTAHGATILEIYGPRPTDWLNYIRSVAAAGNDGKWTFHASGEVQPFEQPERYKARLAKDRFTADLLASYLEAMGLAALDENFYLPGEATLIEKTGPIAPAAREFQLGDLPR